MNELDRRTFLRSVVVATAAVAAAPLERASGAVPDDVEWKRAPCRLCGVGCSLLIGIQGGRAVAVKGDPESPVSRGLACVKGYYAIQALYARDRITAALVRRNGTLTRAPMREALDLVASRLRETMQRHGPDSIAMYGSAQWTAADALVAARLFRGAIGTTALDTSARLTTASAEAGLLSTFGLPGAPGGYADIDHADAFILWDVNLAETDPVLFSRMLERRRANPAVRIIDVATRTTRTSYAADRALLYATHTELAILNAICQEIVARGQIDHGFVERHVAFWKGRTDIGQGLESETLFEDAGTSVDWNAFVRFLADYTPERAQQLSGLAVADIRWLASLYANPALKVVSAWGTRVNEQSRGTWVNNALQNVHLLVGKVAVPGNAAMSMTGTPGGAVLAQEYFGHRGDAIARERLARAWGVAPDRVDPRPARPALSIFRALERGEIRFLWIQATNPMVSLPHLARYRAAARRGDAFLVVSEVYPTATTDLADVVLPAALWFEREGTFANGERRIQHFAALVRPPGDAMSDAAQMIEIAHRLGFDATLGWPPERIAEEAWAVLAGLAKGTAGALPSFTTLRTQPGVLWPATGDGGTSWRYNVAHDPAADRARGDFDFYGHADHRARIWLRPWEAPVESPDRQYPFWLGTGRVVEHWGTGTLTQRIPTLHRAVPRAYVEVNPDDARALGIRDRDRVRLTSRRGSVELEARVDYRGQPPRGRLFAPAFDEGAAVNLLTIDAACPIAGQPDYGACAVRLERVRSAT